jgi:predicted acylesterase/phospholipase RssA
MIGGVSIGAFMGALWCSERNITSVTQKAREWSKVSSNFIANVFVLIESISENDAMGKAIVGFDVSGHVDVFRSTF